MIEALRKIKKHTVDVYAVATVQEEVGIRGAIAASKDVHPDVGIALDVTIASDIPGSDPKDHVSKLGRGVAIKIMDSAFYFQSETEQRTARLGQEEKDRFPDGNSAARRNRCGGIRQVTGHCAVTTISIPLRYVHSTVEMAHKEDLVAAVELLAAYLESTSARATCWTRSYKKTLKS